MNRQEIIERATKVFVVQGIKATTMDDVARNLGISKRTIYEYFEDKRELLDVIIETLYEKKQEEKRNIFRNSANVLEALLALLKLRKHTFSAKVIDRIAEIRRYYPEIFERMFCRPDEMEKAATVFEQGIDEGVFRKDCNSKVSAFLFSERSRVYFTEQFDRIALMTAEHSELSSETLFENLFLNFLRGIATPKGLSIIEKYSDNANGK
jgi:AcrR family transcriptional regulator